MNILLIIFWEEPAATGGAGNVSCANCSSYVFLHLRA